MDQQGIDRRGGPAIRSSFRAIRSPSAVWQGLTVDAVLDQLRDVRTAPDRKAFGSGLMKTAATAVLDIPYQETGRANGRPIVLLNGFPDDIHAYDDVAPPLAA